MSELPATHLPEHPPKRGRGRPPKMKPKAVSEDGGAAGVGAVLGKRGRGRPPKAWKSPLEGLDDGARRPEVVPPVVMKIGRQKGPPRKVVVKRKRKESEEGGGGGGGGKRPRGRPRKEPELKPDAPVGPLVVVPPVVMTIGRQKGPPRTPKKKSKRPRGRPLKPGGRKVVERSGRPVGRPRKAKPGPESQLARPPDPEPEAEAQVMERPRRPRGRPRKVQLQLPVAAPPPEPEPVPEEGVAQGQEATI